MPRTETIIDSDRRGMFTLAVVETFTHRQACDDGSVILADPANRFWKHGGYSWYGHPPSDWDETKAELKTNSVSYTEEVDRS